MFFAFYIVFLRGLQKALFGTLTSTEYDALVERAWYGLTESLMAFTVFHYHAFGMAHIATFSVLLTLKLGHTLLHSRVEWFPLRSDAQQRSKLLHARMIISFLLLAVADAVCLNLCLSGISTSPELGLRVVLASEFAIQLTSLLHSATHHALNLVEAFKYEGQWPEKTGRLLLVGLCADFARLVIYSTVFSYILSVSGLPLNLVRDVYITTRRFITSLLQFLRARQATKDMDSRYPALTPQEIENMSDRTCIICREEFELPVPASDSVTSSSTPQPPNLVPRKLQCGHAFHFECLRGWLERQQSCPTCRRSVLGSDPSPNRSQANVPRAPGDDNAQVHRAAQGTSQTNMPSPAPQQADPTIATTSTSMSSHAVSERGLTDSTDPRTAPDASQSTPAASTSRGASAGERAPPEAQAPFNPLTHLLDLPPMEGHGIYDLSSDLSSLPFVMSSGTSTSFTVPFVEPYLRHEFSKGDRPPEHRNESKILTDGQDIEASAAGLSVHPEHREAPSDSAGPLNDPKISDATVSQASVDPRRAAFEAAERRMQAQSSLAGAKQADIPLGPETQTPITPLKRKTDAELAERNCRNQLEALQDVRLRVDTCIDDLRRIIVDISDPPKDTD